MNTFNKFNTLHTQSLLDDDINTVSVVPCRITLEGQIFQYKVVSDYWKTTVAYFALQDDALQFMWQHNKKWGKQCVT